jgi:outer membrane immunogenic protein
MNRLVLASVLAGVSLAAHAADLSAEPPVVVDGVSPAVSDSFDWMGFYVGGNAGYLWGDSRIFITVGDFDEGSDTFDFGGFIGGGQIGYNFQTGPWVLGIEADLQYSDASGSTDGGCDNCVTKLEWFGTVRGRAGYAVDRLLVYATAGWAYGAVQDSATNPPFSHSETLTGGWAAGGGVEYGFAGNWTARMEYLYMDLGNSDTGPPNNIGGRYDENHIVRVGVNYLFNQNW